MATQTWVGRAAAVAQVASATITAYDATTTYKVTIGTKVISTVGTGGTVTTTATALAALLNASTDPYFATITWSSNAGTVTGTADTAGEPFVATSSVSGGAGTFGAFANTTANAGPNEFTSAANWLSGTAPVNGDTLIFANSNVDLLWGLDQTGLTFAELRVFDSFTGAIGLPDRTFRMAGADSATASEYRVTHLTATAFTKGNLGMPGGTSVGSGSGRLKFDGASGNSTWTIYSTASIATDGAGYEPTIIKGGSSSSFVYVLAGTVGLATANTSDTASFSVISAGGTGTTSSGGLLSSTSSGSTSGPTINVGPGVTVVTISIASGTVVNLGASPSGTVYVNGGTYKTYKSGTHATVNVGTGGTWTHLSDGTVTAANITGTFDGSKDARAKTITTMTVYPGAVVNLDTGANKTITLTNAIVQAGGSKLGKNWTLYTWVAASVTLA